MDASALHEAGRAAWPAIDVPLAAFAAYAAERFPADEHAASLYLTCACARGEERAIATLEQTYFDVVRAAVSRVTRDGVVAGDAIQLLRERLFVTDGDGKERGIAGYAGRGDLRGWLRVAATRAAIGLMRTRRPAEAEADLDRIVAAGDRDPELQLMRRQYAGPANDALRTAFGELEARERTLLRHHFVDGLGIDALGRRYGVHRATAARWLEKAREALETRTRAILVKQLGVGRSTVDSIVRMLQSDLHITLSGR